MVARTTRYCFTAESGLIFLNITWRSLLFCCKITTGRLSSLSSPPSHQPAFCFAAATPADLFHPPSSHSPDVIAISVILCPPFSALALAMDTTFNLCKKSLFRPLYVLVRTQYCAPKASPLASSDCELPEFFVLTNQIHFSRMLPLSNFSRRVLFAQGKLQHQHHIMISKIESNRAKRLECVSRRSGCVALLIEEA